MTKIKNTKKGMAKKTLSISLAVAMLATSNVPVWAAEDLFTDGEVAVETVETVETPVEDVFSDAAEEVVEEAPVVEEEVAVDAQAASDYDFSGVVVDDDSKDLTWDKLVGNVGGFFESTELKMVNGSYENKKLGYVWAFDNEWKNENIGVLETEGSIKDIILPGNMWDHVGENLSLYFLEGTVNGSSMTVTNTTPVATFSLGKVKAIELKDTGLALATIDDVTYNGKEQKPTVNVTTSDMEYGNLPTKWDFNYSGTDGLINAGSVVTVVATPQDCGKAYTGTLETTFKIKKATLNDDNVVIKVTTPEKEFEYTGNDDEVEANSEVNVSLEIDGKASDVSLNDLVKEVTLDRSVVGNASFAVVLDGEKVEASKNFQTAGNAKADIELSAQTVDIDGVKNTVKITKLDLATVTDITAAPVVGAKYDNDKLSTTDLKLVFKKNGKVLDLTGDYDATILAGDYKTPATYNGAISIAAKGSNLVTNSKTVAALVTKSKVFDDNAHFPNRTPGWITEDISKIGLLANGLDYNNGKEVEFAEGDLFKKDGLLGEFDPDGNDETSGSTGGQQSNFKVKYKNNINVGGPVAVMTVYAEGGDYDGCERDFYFNIKPSTVKVGNTKNVTVTTNATEEQPGVTIKDGYTAKDYAEAIGLKINGTNGKADDKEIISNAVEGKDYTVVYSFVNGHDANAATGTNAVGQYVKVVATLKSGGNFNTGANYSALLGDKNTGVYAGTNATEGTVVLWVPILDKAIEDVDIALTETSYVFTGKTIEPKVSVKLDGKELKENTHYTVTVTNGINVGTAKVKVTMIESATGYRGSKTLEAAITPAKLSDVKFAVKKDVKFEYNAKQHTPTIAQPKTATKPAILESVAQATAKLGAVIVSELFDITYGKNIDAGKDAGTVTLTPKADAAKNFEGTSLTATFDIARKALSEVNSGIETVKVVSEDGVILSTIPVQDWTGSAVTLGTATIIASNITGAPTGILPAIELTSDDYEIAYANNEDATLANAKAYVCVVGKGNYGGTKSIVKHVDGSVAVVDTDDVAKTDVVLLDNVIDGTERDFEIANRTFGPKNVTITNATYAGGKAVTPGSVVKDSKNGATLVEGKDYVLVFDTKYVDAGTDKITVSVKGIGQYNGSLVTTKVDGTKLTFSIDKKDLKDCFVTVTKDGEELELKVMNGNVVELKEAFDVVDNGDGTATVSVVDGGKNYTGSQTVTIIDPTDKGAVGMVSIKDVKVVGNKATVILDGPAENAEGYDYVIATEDDYVNGRVDITKNQLKTTGDFFYVQNGTYYAYCHAYRHDEETGKKVFSPEFSERFKFSVTATTPDTPVITDVVRKGSTVTVTYNTADNAAGYDIVLGTASRKVNGEKRPVEYGTLVKKNQTKTTVTFTNVPAGTYYVGMHAYNRTSADGKKVFSPWANWSKKVTVK